jgi:hypothetical protein
MDTDIQYAFLVIIISRVQAGIIDFDPLVFIRRDVEGGFEKIG